MEKSVRLCKRTQKIRYETAGEANDALLTLKLLYNKRRYSIDGKRVNRGYRKQAQKRVYLCEACKGYHMTSMEVYKERDTQDNERLVKKREFYRDFDVESWKSDSLPFDQGHLPPPKDQKFE